MKTASSRQLSSSAPRTISEDQKHSSVVARIHYQKRRSRREVASKAHEYLERLHDDKGSELKKDVRSRISGDSASSEDRNGSKTDTSSNDEGETIAETPPERLSVVPRLKRKNAFLSVFILVAFLVEIHVFALVRGRSPKYP